MCAQIHISFRGLHTLYDLPVYASHSEYFAENGPYSMLQVVSKAG